MHNRYLELKLLGNMWVQIGTEGLELVAKRFDPRTGDEVEQELIPVSLPYMEKERDILLAALDNINALITDLKALEAG